MVKKEESFVDRHFSIFIIICVLGFVILTAVLLSIPYWVDKPKRDLCEQWQPDSNYEEVIKDDITKEQWVKCCVQRVQENGVIKECKYIKTK